MKGTVRIPRVWTCGHVHTRLRRIGVIHRQHKIIPPTKLKKFDPIGCTGFSGGVDMSTRPHSTVRITSTP